MLSDQPSLKDAARNSWAVKFATVLGGVFYSLTLHYIYARYIAPEYYYLGYTLKDPAPDLYIYSLILVSVIALLLPHRVRRPSDFVLWALFVLAIVPSVVVPQFHGGLSQSASLATSAVVSIAFAFTVAIARGLNLRIVPPLRVSATTLGIVIAGVSLFIYAYLAASVGLSFRFVGLLDVYDLREEYKENLAVVAGPLGYVVWWQGYVVNPFVLIFGALRRRWVLVASAGIGQLLLFSVNGSKMILLSSVAVLVVLTVLRIWPQARGFVFLLGAIALAWGCVAIDALRGFGGFFTSLFVRRFVLTSGMLMSNYVVFFSDNPKLYLSQSVLEGFIDYPYTLSYTREVGFAVTGRPDLSMNASAYADGFANAGFVGVLVVGIGLGLVLGVVDDAARGLPLCVPAAMLVMPAIALSNAGLLTVLLTHGLGAVILLLAIMPRSIWSEVSKAEDSGPPAGAKRRGWGLSSAAGLSATGAGLKG